MDRRGGRGLRMRLGAVLVPGVLALIASSSCGGDSPAAPVGEDASLPPAVDPSSTTSTEPPAPDASGGVPDASSVDDGAALPPPWADGVRNGDETDVDCGGATAATPRCSIGKRCAAAGDCASRHCVGVTPTDAGADGGVNGTCQVLAPSCTGAPGTVSCGAAGDENCCTSLPVPGGSYLRNENPDRPTTVSPFKLDKFEITVGRMRKFFEAFGGNLRGNPPTPGAGAHPLIANSGWRESFNTRLPGSWTEINDRLGAAGCTRGGDNSDGGAATWTPTPGPYEDKPIVCIDWFTLFAFCAWDGGRLPTDAEWGFAAMGGSEHRYFAWGNTWPNWADHKGRVTASLEDPADNLVKFTEGTPFRLVDPVTNKVTDGPAHISVPGRKSGVGKWGHADLTGNVLEFLLDRAYILEGQCNDCARVDWPDPPASEVGWYPPQWTPQGDHDIDDARVLRGGSWDPTHVLLLSYYYAYAVYRTYYAAGGRCARD